MRRGEGALARLVATLACTFAIATAHAIPTYAEVKAAHRPSDVQLVDRHGAPLQTLRVDMTVRRLPWVPIEDMSPALLQAIVVSEDRRFWEHGGVDWAAVAKSAWANAVNTKTRGASTLTMQLAGLLDEGLARPGGGRSAWQKVGQAVVARQLESEWSKSRILEAYLNVVPFRGEVVGIGALAQTLFGKHPSGLDAEEAAVAAALVRGPNATPEVVGERACGVLKAMKLDCAGVRTLAATALVRRAGMPLAEQLAPHFARLVVRRDGAAVQRTSLDAGLQRVAGRALREQLAELGGRNVDDGAIVVLDNTSGEVLAWVGANGDSPSAQVDGVLARRQPGSTLKPFVYALAFEQRLLTPASLLDDSPAEIPTAAGAYLPQNYDKDWKGLVSARVALGASLNVPAVRVGAMLAPDALHRRLNDLGFDLAMSGGWYGASLALGSGDVTLLALANAYRALANGGLWSPVANSPSANGGLGSPVANSPSASGGVWSPAALPGATTPKRRVANAAAVHLVTDILADNNARARTFGIDSALRTRGFAAVKTGTSKDMRDNWCVGFTDRYTVAVWVGNASGAPMHDVSGTSGAASVWHQVVRYLHAGRVSRPPAPPAGVVRAKLVYAEGREPPRDELFLAGTQPTGPLAVRSRERRIGITSPRDGAIYALDPDMPLAAQRITFEGQRGTWVLDGRTLGNGAAWRWLPWPGRHELTLLAADGRTIERVRFEVRGAGIKAAARTAAP